MNPALKSVHYHRAQARLPRSPTNMEDWHRELNMSKMSRTLRHIFITGGALNCSVDRAESRISKTHVSRALVLFIHCFWVFYLCHAHVLDLFRGQKPELDLLNRAQRRTRILEVEVRHVDDSTGLMEVTTLKASYDLTKLSL